MENKINREQAEIEFNKWAFETKKISERKMAKSEMVDAKEEFIENIIDGTFSIDSEGNVVQKLKFPIGDFSEFTYKPRMNLAEMQKMKQFKTGDDIGKSKAIMSVLTDRNMGVIDKMDSNDMVNSMCITMFYMVG